MRKWYLLFALFFVAILAIDGQANAGERYTVQKGDTLSAIAHRNSLKVKDLVEVNNITNPNLIREGELIIIPDFSVPSTAGKRDDFRWQKLGGDPWGSWEKNSPAPVIDAAPIPESAKQAMKEWAKENPNPTPDHSVNQGERFEVMGFGAQSGRPRIEQNVVADWQNADKAAAAKFDVTDEDKLYRLNWFQACQNPAVQCLPVPEKPVSILPPAEEEKSVGGNFEASAGYQRRFEFGRHNDTDVVWTDIRYSPIGNETESGTIHYVGGALGGYWYNNKTDGQRFDGYGVRVGVRDKIVDGNNTAEIDLGPEFKVNNGSNGQTQRLSGPSAGVAYTWGDDDPDEPLGGETTISARVFIPAGSDQGANGEEISLGITQDVYRHENYTHQVFAGASFQGGDPTVGFGYRGKIDRNGQAFGAVTVGVDFTDPGTFGVIGYSQDIGGTFLGARKERIAPTTAEDIKRIADSKDEGGRISLLNASADSNSATATVAKVETPKKSTWGVTAEDYERLEEEGILYGAIG